MGATHPSDQTLRAYGLGKLDDASAEAVNIHLEQCPDCRRRVAEASSDNFLDRVRDAQKGSGPTRTGELPAGNGKGAAVPAPADALPPALAAHPDYTVKKELGRGGMGVVYLAHNALMGRDEVLKVIGRPMMERSGVLERFVREIRAVARLRHPNIVAAYAATRMGDSIVFAMEHVEGLDLSKMVKAKGPLPVSHACHFVHQAALGLQHAHEEGLVHRDIKPANLMLSRKGDKATVKVLDFGLAKVAREEKVDGGLTHEGQALGTPDFIAPEQILNAPDVDIRADIYSLGGTLFYLLTGRPPFQGNSLYDIYQAHISRDADPLNLLRPEVPAELAAVVAKMMAKDPDRRFQTPGEVAQALTPFFRRGIAAFKAPSTDISRDGPASPGRRAPGSVSTPTQPATGTGAPAAGASTPAERTVREPRWESLVEIQEENPSTEAVPVVRGRRRPRPPRQRWPIALAASLLGLTALGVLIMIQGKIGEPARRVPPAAPPKIESNGVAAVESSTASRVTPEIGSTPSAGAPGDRPPARRVPPAAPPKIESNRVAVESSTASRVTPEIGSTPSAGAPGDRPPARRVPPAAEGPKLVPLTELNTPGVDADAWVSADGLRIYWTSERGGGAGGPDALSIYCADRPNPGSTFERIRLVVPNGRHPTLTPDQLQIVYLGNAGRKYKQLFGRSRASLQDQFGPELSLGHFGRYVAFNSPAISADGLSLSVNANTTYDKPAVYLISRRKTVTDAWDKPKVLDISWDQRVQKWPLTWITIAPGELSFLATHEAEVGRYRVVQSSRDTIAEPFHRFKYLKLSDGTPVYGRSPRYIGATDELYLTALPVYAQSGEREMWATTKQDLWVIRDFGRSQGWTSDDPAARPRD